MVYTNPGAISNSGNSYFTNQRSKITKMDLDLIRNGDAQYYFANLELENRMGGTTNTNTNTNTNNTINQTDYRLVLAQQKINSKYGRLGEF
jgi:esterase/lipase superfamily enzyme